MIPNEFFVLRTSIGGFQNFVIDVTVEVVSVLNFDTTFRCSSCPGLVYVTIALCLPYIPVTSSAE